MSRNSWYAVLAIALLLLLSVPMFAASQNAVVYGVVYDASGNPMAGVTVTLDNPAFNFARTTTTGSDGSYNFAEVPPAEGYKVTATKAGKTLDARGGIAVNVGDERVILPPLREVVSVAAGGTEAVPKKAKEVGPAVTNETVATNISGVITRDQLMSLPLYNRNFLALGGITPNVHDPEAYNPLGGASFSVAGNRPEQNNFLLDGADNVDSGSNQAIPFQVNDSIQEFRVISSTANAEYGRGAGGTVNVVTRRATNSFHGSVFGYFGSDILNSDSKLSVYNDSTFAQAAAYAGSMNPTALPATPLAPVAVTDYNTYVATAGQFGWCTDSIGLASSTLPCLTGGTGARTLFNPAKILATQDSHKIPFDSKQFGANLGGPIWKDKLFLFGSYEGTLIDNPNPIFERVPSQFDKTYGALNFRDPATFAAPIFGPTDPNFVLAQRVLSLYPTANVIGVPDALAFYQGYAPNYTNVHNGLIRADYVQNEKSSWTARYVVQTLNQLHDDSLPHQAQYAGNGAIRDDLNQNLDVSFNHTFTSNLLNSAHAGFNRFNLTETPQDAGFNATTIGLPTAALPTIQLSGIDSQYSGQNANGANGGLSGWLDTFWPVAFGGFAGSPVMPSLDGLFPMARLGAPLNAPSDRIDTTLYFGDSVSWTHGKHSVKLGAEYRHDGNEFGNAGFARGLVTSSNIGEFTSDSMSCLFCGEAFTTPSYDLALREPSPYLAQLNSNNISWYVQDTWRFHPRFTLNYGVRWDYFGRPTEENNRLYNFDPIANGLVREGSTMVIDQAGQQCPGSGGQLVPNVFVPSGFETQNLWFCQPTGSSTFARSNYKNFAPRVGMAWDVFGNGKTVVRAGFGIFFDQVPAAEYAQLMYNRPDQFNANNPQATWGTNFFTNCTLCGLGNTTLNPANIVANGTQFVQSTSNHFGLFARDMTAQGTPYSRQVSFTVQQTLTNYVSIEMGYIGSAGKNLPAVYNSNWGQELFCPNGGTGCSFNGFAGGSDPFSYLPVYTMTNRAESIYHSLIARAHVAGWHGFRMNLEYAWSRGMDNASDSIFPFTFNPLTNQAFNTLFNTGNPSAGCLTANGIPFIGAGGAVCPTGGLGAGSAFGLVNAVTTTGAGAAVTTPYLIPQDPAGFLTNDWGRSDFNVAHRAVVNYTWDVPALSKAFGAPTWLDNWQLSGIFIAESGQPFTVFAGPIFGEFTSRANVVGPVSVRALPESAINVTGFGLPGLGCAANTATPLTSGPPLPSGTFVDSFGTPCVGNSPRNGFTGPGYITMNFAVQKGFHVWGEGKVLTFRTEFYNLFNRANYYNPVSAISLDGTTINPQFGKILSVHDPRQIQFGARFTW